ncbi:methanogen output domain 1-containing protein [Meridianimarinicoccus roseus]|nr:methanogen output domain 1-containing protein [Meridianimarinicoccus roseus]
MVEKDIPLDRDTFFRQMLRTLSGTLEDVVGLSQAEGYITVVGARLGDAINAMYKERANTSRIPIADVPGILVDLKARLDGDFSVESVDEDKIVLVNARCPFGEKVRGRPSLCMMTSNVFGTIVADSNGYAKVQVEKAIARGDAGCRVIVHLRHSNAPGREYFPDA